MRTAGLSFLSIALPACFIPHPEPDRTPDGALADALTASDGPEFDANPDEVPVDASPFDAAPLSVDGMIAAACTDGVCSAAQVVAYWRGDWDTHAVQRTVRFEEVSATEHRLVVTDGAGNPATLQFEAGVPVSLTVLNPGDATSTGKHDLTAPELFRAVAWRRVRSIHGEMRATFFDAVKVRRRSGSDLSAVLEFVPMNAGTYDVYCQIAVPNGNQYDAIVAGTIDPDLSSPAGHAGKGARALATILPAAGGVTISHASSALGADPRRSPSDPVWANGARNDAYRADPIDMFEFSDEEYSFIPSSASLTRNVGYVLRFANPAENLRAHAFSSSTFFGSAVVREAQDDDVEVETSTLKSIQVLVGDHMEVFAVGTLGGTYSWYCDIGVQLNTDGSPRLNTGHAGRGMVGNLVVSP